MHTTHVEIWGIHFKIVFLSSSKMDMIIYISNLKKTHLKNGQSWIGSISLTLRKLKKTDAYDSGC